jgi:hypothetical protein
MDEIGCRARVHFQALVTDGNRVNRVRLPVPTYALLFLFDSTYSLDVRRPRPLPFVWAKLKGDIGRKFA